MRPLILGINAFHGDSSAALLNNGIFVCGVEEERLNRIKHWAGFPALAIAAVLADVGADLSEVPHVAVSRDPSANLLKKILFTFEKRPSLSAIRDRLKNHGRIANIEELLNSTLSPRERDGVREPEPASSLTRASLALSRRERGKEVPRVFRGKIHNVEHHRAHLASAFFCSPFEDAACLTVDGFGDFLSSMSAVGRGNRIEPLESVAFPHSLGIFYTAVTQFLGFPKYGDEYKVMGLASYGKPTFLKEMREIVRPTAEGSFEVDLDYFRHATEGVTMSWEAGEPFIGQIWSPKFVTLLGPAREPGSELTGRHEDLAASLQAMYEEIFFHRLRWLHQKTGSTRLCMAGGCAYNSVANGKIFQNTEFRDVYIQSAAGDAGTALGAALHVSHEILNRPRLFVMEHSYYGPEFNDTEIRAALEAKIKEGLLDWDPLTLPSPSRERVGAAGDRVRGEPCRVRRIENEDELFGETAAAIADGKIIGWYQGRSEWGPRALGNRSILVDPRRAEMKDVLNSRIKRREPFRPFAPSILEERVGDYFEETYPDPFMIKVYPVRPEMRAKIPAVTHVDGTGRLQTVSKRQNPRYWGLIHAFEEKTGVPVLLNTSFNENEPIVNTPAEALDCFLRTKMDRLVLGDWVVRRESPHPIPLPIGRGWRGETEPGDGSSTRR